MMLQGEEQLTTASIATRVTAFPSSCKNWLDCPPGMFACATIEGRLQGLGHDANSRTRCEDALVHRHEPDTRLLGSALMTYILPTRVELR
jgi:hypothetical protein